MHKKRIDHWSAYVSIIPSVPGPVRIVDLDNLWTALRVHNPDNSTSWRFEPSLAKRQGLEAGYLGITRDWDPITGDLESGRQAAKELLAVKYPAVPYRVQPEFDGAANRIRDALPDGYRVVVVNLTTLATTWDSYLVDTHRAKITATLIHKQAGQYDAQ